MREPKEPEYSVMQFLKIALLSERAKSPPKVSAAGCRPERGGLRSGFRSGFQSGFTCVGTLAKRGELRSGFRGGF